jgi:NitT/TauT family transport system permease protein
MEKIPKATGSFFMLLLFFILWEAVALLWGGATALLPRFSAAVVNVIAMFKTRDLAEHIGVSFLRSLAGITAGALAGVPLGFLLAAATEKLRIVLNSFTGVLSHINPFLLYHVMLYFLGIGEGSKIFILASGCAWPVIFNTAAGVENIDGTLLKAGKGFGGGKLSLLLKVMFPASAPAILDGIRISAGYALLMLTAAEILGARSGLGFLVVTEQAYFRITNLYSILLVTAVLGVLIDLGLGFIKKKTFPYELDGYNNSSMN